MIFSRRIPTLVRDWLTFLSIMVVVKVQTVNIFWPDEVPLKVTFNNEQFKISSSCWRVQVLAHMLYSINKFFFYFKSDQISNSNDFDRYQMLHLKMLHHCVIKVLICIPRNCKNFKEKKHLFKHSFYFVVY